MGSPHGWTRKPCHGCGSTELHRKDKLCPDCQRIFDDGLLAREKQDHQKDKIMVKHDKASHLISGPYLFDNSGIFISSRLNERLRRAWGALTISVTELAVGIKNHNAPYLIIDKKDTWGVKNDFYGYHDDEYFLVESHIRDSLNEFDLSLRLAMEYLYLAGKQQGLKILSGLNEGIIALSNYEEQLEKVGNRLNKIGEWVKETNWTFQ